VLPGKDLHKSVTCDLGLPMQKAFYSVKSWRAIGSAFRKHTKGNKQIYVACHTLQQRLWSEKVHVMQLEIGKEGENEKVKKASCVFVVDLILYCFNFLSLTDCAVLQHVF